jgi:hypothetical protein
MRTITRLHVSAHSSGHAVLVCIHFRDPKNIEITGSIFSALMSVQRSSKSRATSRLLLHEAIFIAVDPLLDVA